jgi:hypothetical protein
MINTRSANECFIKAPLSFPTADVAASAQNQAFNAIAPGKIHTRQRRQQGHGRLVGYEPLKTACARPTRLVSSRSGKL